jgi:putative sterol carrier protein
VRWLLQVLAETAEGNTVEVRVPPFGAVQAIEGPRHTRGTPPNVIETDATTWLALATGELGWAEAVGTGRVSASGQRADLTAYLPLAWETMES